MTIRCKSCLTGLFTTNNPKKQLHKLQRDLVCMKCMQKGVAFISKFLFL